MKQALLFSHSFYYIQVEQCQTNDECTNAALVGTLPYTDISTTEFSTSGGYETNSSLPNCIGILPGLRGNWYHVVAESSTCLSASVKFPYSSGLYVYEGSDCNDLVCIVESFYSTGTVTWKTEEGKVYSILVGHDGASSSDEYLFTLLVRCNRVAIRFC
jgi:hypothetical protein